MSLSPKEKRAAIIALFLQGKRPFEIETLVPASKKTVLRAIKRYEELGSLQDRPKTGRPRTADTAKNRKLIRERIKRKSQRSMRKMAKDLDISEGSVRNIVKKKLKLKSLKLQKGQHLNDRIRQVRKQRCLALKRRLGAQGHLKVIFSDEKIFTIEQSRNIQNDRILTPNSTEANKKGRTVSRIQKPKSVMVWGGVTAKGKLPLVFVENGVKINANNYVEDILKPVVLPWIQANAEGGPWIFQQDSAPSHRAKTTQNWISTNFGDFITSQEWPPYSPDCNPLDYSLWGILDSKACTSAHKSEESLKKSLRREWNKISPETLRAVVDQFPKRLNACIKANGGYFENSF